MRVCRIAVRKHLPYSQRQVSLIKSPALPSKSLKGTTSPALSFKSSMVNIKEAAQAAITAYGLATQQGGNASVPLQSVADSLASFYLTNFTSFTLGGITTLGTHDIAASGVLGQLQKLNQSGLGTDIRLCSGRVDVVSCQSALCWVTFVITPRTDKIKQWSWTNVYGFRLEEGRSNGLEGGWEFTNADQEIQTLLERVPDFYTGGTV